ncbi:diguanylate cyclase domain-containing protein [Marinimicrobium agarilyticum]|uniref:diguanylate cyclase domain-containing protein n=1 Tax=Marinimicrobium agarilyticum TaxID=306546 RepID=UPI0004077BC3|nr:diguanylate cyclase [Marinimicrobium agarilyticum]
MSDRKIRILCMEDDAGLAQLMKKRLHRSGYEMEWATDGGAGLERLQRDAFDVVAIDYEMPVMNGLAVLEKIQATGDTPPAIMISGAGDMDTAIKAMKAGAADYVVKTVDGSYLELLPRTIEKVLEKQRLREAAATAQQELQEKTELLSLTLASIAEGLSVFDRDLRLKAWNQVLVDLLGCPEDLAVVGTPLSSFPLLNARSMSRRDGPGVAENILLARDGKEQSGEYVLADGRALEVRSGPMPNGGVVSTYTDISARKAGEEEQRVAAAVFQTSAEPMLIMDPQIGIQRCNPAFEALLGYSMDELYGKTPAQLASDRHNNAFFEELASTLRKEGRWRGIIWNRQKNDALSAQQVSLSAITDDMGQVEHFVAVYTDVTEQIEREEGARYEAYHDALTGLPNRSLLFDRIGHAIEVAKRDKKGFAILFLDLDGFKPINDNYGHRVGDLLLQEVAKRLRYRCRDSDTVARYGGDEFVVLLRDSDSAHAVGGVAQSLIDDGAESVTIDGVDHSINLSIGSALYPHHDTTPEGLLKKADEAMYDAKAAGKGCHRLYHEPD